MTCFLCFTHFCYPSFSADDRFDGTFPVNAVLFSTGVINWIPPGMFKSTCKINILWFPFDEQSCDLKFGSWTYASVALDLVIKDPRGGDTQSFIRNGEWDLIGRKRLFSRPSWSINVLP